MEAKHQCILDTRCPGKRLQNELRYDWTDAYQSTVNTYYHNTNNDTMTFFMFLENIVNPITIKFKFNSRGSYPFRPPEVLIGNSNYSYTCLLPTQWSFAQKIYGSECACCSSITCRDNWGPSNKLLNITDEIRDNFNKKIRIMEIFHCKKIVEKHFGHYLPIEEFL
jgi:hypothetical protein